MRPANGPPAGWCRTGHAGGIAGACLGYRVPWPPSRCRFRATVRCPGGMLPTDEAAPGRRSLPGPCRRGPRGRGEAGPQSAFPRSRAGRAPGLGDPCLDRPPTTRGRAARCGPGEVMGRGIRRSAIPRARFARAGGAARPAGRRLPVAGRQGPHPSPRDRCPVPGDGAGEGADPRPASAARRPECPPRRPPPHTRIGADPRSTAWSPP